MLTVTRRMFLGATVSSLALGSVEGRADDTTATIPAAPTGGRSGSIDIVLQVNGNKCRLRWTRAPRCWMHCVNG
jgi:hypothetical protein